MRPSAGDGPWAGNRLNLRAFGRIAAVLAVLVVCLAGHALGHLTGRQRIWVQRFLAGAARALGADIGILGRPLDRDVLFVANHLSWFDILGLGGATGTAFVSKDAVARWPVVGWLARLGGTIFIAHTSRTTARSQADALTHALAAGRPVALFPEGTTNDGTTLRPFRAALIAAATATGVRVQPVAIDYGALAPEIAWKDEESAPQVARRLITRAGRIPITLHFLDPLPPSADRKQLAADARAAIVARLGG
ncbi:MAG TPA: lysophospholipid acyltransferase family protein [Sphingomonas sp.]|jgi:1-acyl-sn-glycerol-3-phosphate acyltransferase|uniref:lysophospholipid acyltransferase family protein n=1 Tax=Sphingomonas sp. TaxID=28214 RepID=UPI002ED927B3